MKPRARSEWIAAAASTAVAPRRSVQARHSSSPAVKKLNSPSSCVGQADDAAAARLGDAQVLHEERRVVLGELARSPPRSCRPAPRRPSCGWPIAYLRPPPRASARSAQLRLVDVQHHQHRLLGQEPVATQPSAPRRRRGRRSGAACPSDEVRLAAASSSASSWAFCSRSAGDAVAAGGAQLLQPLLDHRQVGDRELQVELLDVAPRIGRALGGAGLEGASHVQQRVGVADLGQHVGLDRPLAGCARPGWRRRRR